MPKFVVCIVCDCKALGSLHDDKLVVSLSMPSPESLVMHEEQPRTLVQVV
jgi:hypothetical protein